MRGVETRIQEIRHKIFTEVARMAYHTEWPVKDRMEALPYKIIPGEKGNFRNDVFLERAIVGERLRLAMGLPYSSAAEHSPISDGIEAADKDETYYTPPLINVIKFACNACPEKRVHVTDGCQGCLAHPCMEVCPKDAVSLDRTTGKSVIDQEKCIKCGRCASVCSYNAIIVQERPCAKACGMDAISSDENGKANIDYDKCVSCGQCLVNCPFGAIADKSQIFQTIRAIQSGEKVYAAVAPAFVGQFGPKVTPGKLRAAMKALGFADVFEVAIGADLCAKQEAEDFLKEVPDELPFMAFILTAITVIAGLLLGVVYGVTKEPIANAKANSKQEAFQSVLSDADSFETVDDLDTDAASELLKSNGYSSDAIEEVALGKDKSGETIGYVINVVSHEGYGGDIEISVGIQADGTVKGIEMLSISETAGLGMKATEPAFKDQFKDKKVETFSYTKTGEEGDDKIDAISGATITTNAVTNAVDSALVYFQNELGGGSNE